MNLTSILLSLLAEAPNFITDAEQAVAEFKASPDAGTKARAVVAGLDHVAANVLPLLKQ